MSTESTHPVPERNEEPTQVFETSTPEEPTRAFEDASAASSEPAWTESSSHEVFEPVVVDRSRIRPGTIVWGLVVALVGLATLGWAQGLRFDVQLASIGVLAAAGVLLVVSAVFRNRKA